MFQGIQDQSKRQLNRRRSDRTHHVQAGFQIDYFSLLQTKFIKINIKVSAF